MTDPTPLSPAAQAVAKAYDYTPEEGVSGGHFYWLAAALRAAALICKRDSAILLSLADELEGNFKFGED